LIVSGFVTSPEDQSRICFEARPIRIAVEIVDVDQVPPRP
jgi:hypothetical protein